MKNSGNLVHCMYPIIKAPNGKPVLPSAAQTRNSTGQKICTCIVLTLTGEQKVLSQRGEVHGLCASNAKFRLEMVCEERSRQAQMA